MLPDVFSSKELRSLLKNKKVVLLGDSNTRATYKDFLCLYEKNALVPQQVLKTKLEESVFGDKLMEHSRLNKGRNFIEQRLFQSRHSTISFYFITRVYSEYVEKILSSFQEQGQPDIIILNSFLWDITRWGPRGVEGFKQNLTMLMERFNQVLDENCLVIWVTTPPVSKDLKGGFLIRQLDFLRYSLRFHILEANTFAREVVVAAGYDVVDIHYHLQMQLTQRADDGIHWVPLGVRHVTNLLLTHIANAWGVPLPHRIDTWLLRKKMLDASFLDQEADEIKGPNHEQDAASEGQQTCKNNDFDETYHGFETRKRQKQAYRKIRQWGREPYQPPILSSPVVSHCESRAVPYQQHHSHVSQHHPETNYYHQYHNNSLASCDVMDPKSLRPSFNGSGRKQTKFGKRTFPSSGEFRKWNKDTSSQYRPTVITHGHHVVIRTPHSHISWKKLKGHLKEMYDQICFVDVHNLSSGCEIIIRCGCPEVASAVGDYIRWADMKIFATDAASEVHEVSAMKRSKNEQGSLSQQSKKRLKTHEHIDFDITFRGYEVRKRQKQARYKIR